MSFSDNTIQEGQDTTLRWSSSNTSSVYIDRGIGNVGGNGSSIVSLPVGTYTYQGTFYGTNGQTITCLATLTVSPRQHYYYGYTNTNLTPLPIVSQPLASLYLADLPYTGLDLGPIGTALYWIALIVWSVALAYLIFWSLAPLALKRVQSGVKHPAPATAHQSEPVAPVAETHVVAVAHSTPKLPATVSYEDFKSEVQSMGTALSIEDIVKGLSRHAADERAYTDMSAQKEIEEVIAPVTEQINQITERAPIAARQAVPPTATALPHDVPAFISALLNAEKETVFSMIRELNRAGHDVEDFLTHVVVALDDAYRAKIDGTPVHPEVAKVCIDCAPSFLERVVSALTTVVDGSYMTGVTGVKLALTRALHAVEG